MMFKDAMTKLVRAAADKVAEVLPAVWEEKVNCLYTLKEQGAQRRAPLAASQNVMDLKVTGTTIFRQRWRYALHVVSALATMQVAVPDGATLIQVPYLPQVPANIVKDLLTLLEASPASPTPTTPPDADTGILVELKELDLYFEVTGGR